MRERKAILRDGGDGEKLQVMNQQGADTGTQTVGRTKRQAAARFDIEKPDLRYLHSFCCRALTHLQEISETERRMKADDAPPPQSPQEIVSLLYTLSPFFKY